MSGQPAVPAPPPGVAELIEQARAWSLRVDRRDLLTRLDAAAARLASPACHVVVLGEFKKGKSSLLNALLNARVCPTDADVATAVPTYLRFGEVFEATAAPASALPDGHGTGPSQPLDPATAEAAALGRGPDGEAGSVHVRLPRDLLRTGMVLVDTPGVGGGLASSHAGVALRALARADVVLFVADAGSEYSAPELELLGEAVRTCPAVVCAVTKTDLHPQWRRIVEADRAHLAAIGVDAPLVPVSAPLRQAGLREDDDELVLESGFPRLTSELLAAADATSGTAQASAVAVVLSTVGQVRAEVSARRENLTGAGPDAGRQRAADEARDRAQELRSVGARWQQVLADRMDDLHGEVELDLTVRLRRIKKDAAEHLRDAHPSRMAADLGPWVQRRTNEALLDHVRRLRDEVEAVADAVADQFGSAAWELRSGIDLDPARVDGEGARGVVLSSALDQRLTRFEVGLAAVRGGATGAMVTHVVGMVVGIAVPVVLPAAVVLSSVLAGKAWQSARSSQLRQLRSEAERAVALYLEEVDTVARKDSRDALRRTRRHLREVFGERAVEMHATAVRTVEAMATRRTDDEGSRRRQLEQADADLADLARLTARCTVLIDELVPTR